MRWNAAEVARTPSTIAVLGPDGVLIDTYADYDEALHVARAASPTGTVAVDESVDARSDHLDVFENPAGAIARASEKALAASRIQVDAIGIDWSTFDPRSKDGRATIRESRERLRERGKSLYDELLELAAREIHVTQKRGGVASTFHNNWLTDDFLRQNMKMKKVLETSDSYDSIGLSLLPHGASFRPPFSTSTDQGAGGATNCLFSTAECRKVCLVNTGQRALESGSFAASYLFSHLLREMPEEFLVNLFERSVLAYEAAGADGFYRFIRLNVLSDLPWELISPDFIPAVCEYARRGLGRKMWKWTRGYAFYDYTKIPGRAGVPGYYDLTLSFSGARALFPSFFDVLEGKPGAAKRTAVVFVRREKDVVRGTGAPYRAAPGKPLMSKELAYQPWSFMKHRVWNGDLSDIRPLDPDEVKIVGLAYKVARYKIAAPKGSGKKFGLQNIVPVNELDKELPTFLVRVMQPDPDAPPFVVATQDPDNRKLSLPVFR